MNEIPPNQLFYVAAKAVIQQDDKMLFLKAFNEHTGREYWDLPGGRMQAGEEIEQTLQRELREELPGITNINTHGILHSGKAFDANETKAGIFIVMFHITATLPDPVSYSHEHHGFKWVSSSELDDMKRTASEPILGHHEYAAAKHLMTSS